jgi:translation initiation factor 3 subunit B
VPLAPALTPAPPQIAGNLKKYSKRYDEVDASLAAEADTALVAERAALMDDWLAWLRSKRQAMDSESYRAALVALIGPPKSAEAEAYSSETVEVEELISVNEERLF